MHKWNPPTVQSSERVIRQAPFFSRARVRFCVPRWGLKPNCTWPLCIAPEAAL